MDWKTYLAVYDLLEEIFEKEALPDILLLDAPLILGRRNFPQALAETDEQKLDIHLREEIDALRQKIESFWDKHRSRCFPYAENGPKIISLHRGQLREPIAALQGRGAMTTPDHIDADVLEMMRTEWAQVLSVGIERLLLGILTADHRTAAFQREHAKDKDAFSKITHRGRHAHFQLPHWDARPAGACGDDRLCAGLDGTRRLGRAGCAGRGSNG